MELFQDMDVNILSICNSGLPYIWYLLLWCLKSCFLNTLHSNALAVITVRKINWCCCRSDLSWIFIFCVAAPLFLSVFILVSCVLFIIIANIGSTSGSEELYLHIFSCDGKERGSLFSVTTHELFKGVPLAPPAEPFFPIQELQILCPQPPQNPLSSS